MFSDMEIQQLISLVSRSDQCYINLYQQYTSAEHTTSSSLFGWSIMVHLKDRSYPIESDAKYLMINLELISTQNAIPVLMVIYIVDRFIDRIDVFSANLDRLPISDDYFCGGVLAPWVTHEIVTLTVDNQPSQHGYC